MIYNFETTSKTSKSPTVTGDVIDEHLHSEGEPESDYEDCDESNETLIDDNGSGIRRPSKYSD